MKKTYEGVLTQEFDGVRDYWVLNKDGKRVVNLTIDLSDFEKEQVKITIEKIEIGKEEKILEPDELEALFLVELPTLPSGYVNQLHFFENWLKDRNQPTTMENIRVLQRVYMGYAGKKFKDTFKKIGEMFRGKEK